jgi:RNA polymerase sigma-70 factor (ECF subfamily)
MAELRVVAAMETSAPTRQVELVHKLFLKHDGELRGFIRALVADADLAADVLHEVFLLVTAKADSYQDGTNFLGWLKAIARLKVLEAARARRSRAELLSPEVIESLCAAAPEAEMDETQLIAIRSCIHNLPRRAKTLIDMRYRLECKPAEIAKRIGWQTQSVSVELSKTREALRRCLQRKLGMNGTE